MTLIEGAALGILPSQTNWIPFQQQRAKSQRFRKTVIDGSFAVPHLRTLLKQLDDLGMHVKAVRNADQRVGDLRQPRGVQAGFRFVLRFKTSAAVGRPLFWQLPKLRNLSDLARLGLLFFILLAHILDDLHGLHADALGVDAPERRMILNAFVHARLRDGGIVYFAMTVAPVANDVDHHVTAKLRAIVCGQLAYAHDGVRVFAVDVKDRNILALGDIRGESRGLFLLGPRGKANQIVDDDVDCSTNG